MSSEQIRKRSHTGGEETGLKAHDTKKRRKITLNSAPKKKITLQISANKAKKNMMFCVVKEEKRNSAPNKGGPWRCPKAK